MEMSRYSASMDALADILHISCLRDNLYHYKSCKTYDCCYYGQNQLNFEDKHINYVWTDDSKSIDIAKWN
jgi:hypothetical protein